MCSPETVAGATAHTATVPRAGKAAASASPAAVSGGSRRW